MKWKLAIYYHWNSVVMWLMGHWFNFLHLLKYRRRWKPPTEQDKAEARELLDELRKKRSND